MNKFCIYPLLFFAVASCAGQSASVGFGRIVATSYHDDSGHALEGVLVAVGAPQYYGRYPTNSEGIVNLERVPDGEWFVEAHCPSKTGVGREILVKHIRVRAGHTTTFEISVPNGFCDEPEYSVRKLTITGHFIHGFELSNFSPCNPDELDLTKNIFSDQPGVWVWLPTETYAEIESNVVYLLTAHGTFTGPGQFGHMGVSAYEFDIDEVLSYETNAETDCSNVKK